MNLSTIVTIEEFSKILENNNGHLLFFIHSNWSIESEIGLQKLKDILNTTKSMNKVTIIDNSSSSSFIYSWLKEQEGKNWANKTIKIPHKNGSWIHGKGELFEIKNKTLSFFELSTVNLKQEFIIKLLN